MKVTYMPGIESISGSMKSKTGKSVVFTHRKTDKPGQGRMYLRNPHDYQRTTPISESESAARLLFSRRAERVKVLLNSGACKTKKEAWDMAKKEIR